jgi:tyrosyl-tRNA synthetase
MQGYDFYWLYQKKNCKLQMGGSDQWGNITTGTEFIRRKMGGEAFALTCPLLTKSDGGKFGKSEKGNVWLAPEKTSPYEFYQFWINAADADAEKWIKIFTFLSKETIDQLIEDHRKDAAARLLQKTLAKEVTVFVHGEAGYQEALDTTEKTFGKQNAPAESLTLEDLEGMDGVTKFDYELAKVQTGVDIVTFLAESKIFPSKGEARKMVQGGGVSINRKKVEDVQLTIDSSLLLHGQYMIVQKGKKHFYLVKAV